MTFLVPKGYYETEDVTYLMNGVEKPVPSSKTEVSSI